MTKQNKALMAEFEAAAKSDVTTPAPAERDCENCRRLSYSDMLRHKLHPVPCLDEALTMQQIADIARPVYHRTFCATAEIVKRGDEPGGRK